MRTRIEVAAIRVYLELRGFELCYVLCLLAGIALVLGLSDLDHQPLRPAVGIGNPRAKQALVECDVLSSHRS